jgi:hypothetical protein
LPGTVPARELAEEAIPVPGGVGPIGPAKARSGAVEDGRRPAVARAPGRADNPHLNRAPARVLRMQDP